MTASKALDLLVELTELYFVGATVRLAKQNFAVKPHKPLVKITTISNNVALNPPMTIDDGRPTAFNPAVMKVQIDLFTKGRELAKSGAMPEMENTSLEDLTAFANFLNSPFAIGWCHQRDIAIITAANITDMTNLINDSNYEFRSMLEAELRYTHTSVGYTGILDEADSSASGSAGGGGTGSEAGTSKPSITLTPSGGGNSALLPAEDNYFENVEINNRLVKEDDGA